MIINCPKCNEEFDPYSKWGLKKFCSRKCANSHVRTEESKKKTSESCGNSEKFKLALQNKNRYIPCSEDKKIKISNTLKKYFLTNEIKYGYKIHPSKRRKKGYIFSEEARKKLSEVAKLRYKLNPDSHPNRRCAGLKESYPERMVREYLEINNLVKNQDFIQQYNVESYYVDFYFPNLNLGLEIDGEYWHRDQEKDLIRENKIKKYFNIIRFKAKDVLKKAHQYELDLIISNINSGIRINDGAPVFQTDTERV